MKLTEISNYLLYANGQHLSGDLARLRLDLEKLWVVVEQELREYERFFPWTKRFNIVVPATPNPTYDFTFDSNNSGYDADADPDPLPGLPPIWISQCVPIGYVQQVQNYQQMITTMTFPGQLDRVAAPMSAIFEYREPKLYVRFGTRYDITAHYRYSFTKTTGPITTGATKLVLKEVEIEGIDPDAKIFLDLLSAKFLQMVGRSRRAFTHNQLAITTDADQLVREGEEKYEAARKLMYDRCAFQTSIRL